MLLHRSGERYGKLFVLDLVDRSRSGGDNLLRRIFRFGTWAFATSAGWMRRWEAIIIVSALTGKNNYDGCRHAGAD